MKVENPFVNYSREAQRQEERQRASFLARSRIPFSEAEKIITRARHMGPIRVFGDWAIKPFWRNPNNAPKLKNSQYKDPYSSHHF